MKNNILQRMLIDREELKLYHKLLSKYRYIDEIDERYLKGLKFHFVTDMYEVIDKALLKEKAK